MIAIFSALFRLIIQIVIAMVFALALLWAIGNNNEDSEKIATFLHFLS